MDSPGMSSCLVGFSLPLTSLAGLLMVVVQGRMVMRTTNLALILAPSLMRMLPTMVVLAPMRTRAVTNLRVAISDGIVNATKGDMMEDGNIVADDGSLVNDDAGGMVEEEVMVEAGGRVDVDHEDVGDAGLEGKGKGPTVLE